ncbi:Ubiquitin-like domain-containing CTD phosphatase-like protein [Drosera capensis]
MSGESSSSSSAAAAPSSSSAMETEVEEMTLTVKWCGKEYTVRVCGDDTIGELKRRICEVTNVLPKRQKLLYPKVIGSKLSDDSSLLSQITLKASIKMTMIGTVEDEIIIDQVDSPEVVDDFELGQDGVVEIKDKPANQQKLRRRVQQYKVLDHPDSERNQSALKLDICSLIKLRNPCREGKKLLVLDIDYTLFDHRSPAENPLELMRPYLHEFLTASYAEYDIMIWSATSMRWVELKMEQLGVLSNPQYKITALLDHLGMIVVQSDSHGSFDCKPPGLIWEQFPKLYNSKNTIMFDDLRRNFVMNPQNGLEIKPFRKAHSNRGSDQELVKLTQYLLSIAELDDLSHLDHRNWERYTESTVKRRRHA